MKNAETTRREALEYQVTTMLNQVRIDLRRIASTYVTAGRLLRDLKEITPHGEWGTTAKRIGYTTQHLNRLIQTADATDAGMLDVEQADSLGSTLNEVLDVIRDAAEQRDEPDGAPRPPRPQATSLGAAGRVVSRLKNAAMWAHLGRDPAKHDLPALGPVMTADQFVALATELFADPETPTRAALEAQGIDVVVIDDSDA